MNDFIDLSTGVGFLRIIPEQELFQGHLNQEYIQLLVIIYTYRQHI